MHIFGKYKILVFFLLLFVSSCDYQILNFEYRIDVPKYSCDNKNGTTTIRLTGKDFKTLGYKWEVYFTTNNTCTEQRCTLIIWKAVRELETYLNQVCNLKVCEADIRINNSMLISYIKSYILNVTISYNEAVLEKKQFQLECMNDVNLINTSSTTDLLRSENILKKPGVILQGPNITYTDMEYLLKAEAKLFDASIDYYFQWKLYSFYNNLSIAFPTKGSILQILPKTLIAKENYTIICNLIETNGHKVIVMESHNLIVLEREVVLKIVTTALVVGVHQPFRLSAFFNDVDNRIEKSEIQWSCIDSNLRPCQQFKSTNETSIDVVGFANVGRYNISTAVLKNNKVIKEDICKVEVTAESNAIIEVDDLHYPIDSTQEILIVAHASSLRSGCSLQWQSLPKLGYAHLDLREVPGKLDAVMNLTVTEDLFLNDIDEFSKKTVDRSFNLRIPAPNGIWNGLRSSSKYMFRLNVDCPTMHETITAADQKYSRVYADIELYTATPPVLDSLEINPLSGVALRTLFNFRVVEVNGNIHRPILYKIGYMLNNVAVFVEQLLDIRTTQTYLPYGKEDGIQTIVEACNSHAICTKINGPKVHTTIQIFNQTEERKLINELNQYLNRQEYRTYFTTAFATLQTYNASNNTTLLRNMEYEIINMTITTIFEVLNHTSDKKQLKQSANYLLKHISLLLKGISAPSNNLLNAIVLLRNEVVPVKTGVINVIPMKHNIRKLLAVDTSLRGRSEWTTLDDVKNYLIISELIITTSRDKNRVRQEKQNLLNQLDYFMQGLCTTLYEKPQAMILELKTIIITVEKINKNNLDKYTHILFNENNWKVNGRLKLGACAVEQLARKGQLCIGKAAFKNYLTKKGVAYMAKLYSSSSDIVEDTQVSCDSVMILPLNEKLMENKEPKCAVWENRWLQSHCKTIHLTNITIQCTCNNLQYYTLEYVPAAEMPSHIQFTTENIVISNIPKVGDITTPTIENPSDNVTVVIFNGSQDEYNIIYYFLLGFSVVSIAVLICAIKHLTSKEETKPVDHTISYAPLFEEDMLNDIPVISKQ